MSELDDLYYSNDPLKILSFYYKFNDIKEIVEWLKNRPDTEKKIYEFEGDSEIVIVVPTSDINNENSKYIRKTFNKNHLIFIESKGKYFNFSRSVNEGVKIAMKYNPKYVIISNDDILVNNPDELIKEIAEKDNKKITAMIAGKGNYSIELLKFREKLSDPIIKFVSKFTKSYYIRLFSIRYSILRRFNLSYYLYVGESNHKSEILSEILGKKILEIKNINKFGFFMIISSVYIKDRNNTPLDPFYINGVEDIDLYINILANKLKIEILKNKVIDLGSKSLGTSIIRCYRNIINFIYFNYKIINGYIPIN